MNNLTRPTTLDAPRQTHIFPRSSSIIGCILWLKAEIQAERLLQCGLNKEACNHPCVVVDVSTKNGIEEEEVVVICIITSFKKKTAEEIIRVLRRSPSLIPILPNEVTTFSTTRLELSDDVRLRRESWVNTSTTYTVPMSLVRQYDWDLPLCHFKLTTQSIQCLRDNLNLPPQYEILELATQSNERIISKDSRPITQITCSTISQNSRPDSSTNAVSRQRTDEGLAHESLPHLKPRQDTSRVQPLLKNQVERSGYGTYHDSSTEPQHEIGRQQRINQYRRLYNSPEPRTQPSTSRVESTEWDEEALRRMPPSSSNSGRMIQENQMPSRWPSRETVTTIVFLGIGVAVVGGLGFGGYLLAKATLGVIARFLHEVFSVISKATAAIGGAWNWSVNMVRGIGQGLGTAWHEMALAVEKVVAAVKAMLGRK